MREIKFRAWHDTTKIMIPDVSTGTIKVFDNKGRMFDSAEVIFQQYSGLKDKNGKEIYEGDFLLTDDGEESCRCKIVWTPDKAKYEILAWCGGSEWDNVFDDIEDTKLFDFEVIGNIYENPDLLT